MIIVLGFAFALGAIIDEAQGHHNVSNYINVRGFSNARSLLVLMWIFVGISLTFCYKSTLRAMMMKVDYEDTIDTVDDMLVSGRKLMVTEDSGLRDFVEGDPRMKVDKLGKQVEYFNRGRKMPEWVING